MSPRTFRVFGHCRLSLLIPLWISMVSISVGDEPVLVLHSERGYLFIDGEYIPPPYEVTNSAEGISANGIRIDRAYAGEVESDSGNVGLPPRGRRRWALSAGFAPNGRRGSRVNDRLDRDAFALRQLAMGSVVFLTRESRPASIHVQDGRYELLRQIVGLDTVSTSVPANLNTSSREAWNWLTTEYKPTEAFISHAMADIELVETNASDADSVASSANLLANLSYPLTLLGMVGVVLGFGHLLSSRPVSESDAADDPHHHGVINKSLLIIAVLSLVDLVWTLVASNAGVMRELSPIGSQLIDNPAHLTAFKFSMTATSLSILYCLKRRPIARLASWWCCLLLTLLTARWIVFNSMFL
ncbi:MAG: DUF5658 family protein [Planctomycetota bacterium]